MDQPTARVDVTEHSSTITIHRPGPRAQPQNLHWNRADVAQVLALADTRLRLRGFRRTRAWKATADPATGASTWTTPIALIGAGEAFLRRRTDGTATLSTTGVPAAHASIHLVGTLEPRLAAAQALLVDGLGLVGDWRETPTGWAVPVAHIDAGQPNPRPTAPTRIDTRVDIVRARVRVTVSGRSALITRRIVGHIVNESPSGLTIIGSVTGGQTREYDIVRARIVRVDRGVPVPV